MKGKRFLDLGCNHGFFCFAALERGAKEAVGIDISEANIAAAKARAKALGVEDRVSFRKMSWDDFHETGFDVIILLSAMHYAPDQPGLLKRIADMLSPTGTFVLEGGVINGNARTGWTAIMRGKPPRTDIVEYPTDAMMIQTLIEAGLAPRKIGPSTLQPGDNIPRFVWHAPRLRRMILTIGAMPRNGKTTFAGTLKKKGVPVIDIDGWVSKERTRDTTLGRAIASSYKLGFLNRCLDKIESEGLQQELADLVMDKINEVPKGENTVAIMGMSMMYPNFVHSLRKAAEANHAVLWESSRTV